MALLVAVLLMVGLLAIFSLLGFSIWGHNGAHNKYLGSISATTVLKVFVGGWSWHRRGVAHGLVGKATVDVVVASTYSLPGDEVGP